MRLLLSSLIFGSTFVTSFAQLTEVSGFQNPESVIAFRDKIFVSNMGRQLDPKAKDGDGYISMISRFDGKMLQEKCMSGLNSPKGLLVCMGKLIVADVDKVLAFDIKTGKKIWETDLEPFGVTYANDLAKSCGSVFVSATLKDAIFKVSRSGKVKKLNVKGNLSGANGIRRGCGKLFVANFGRGEKADGSFGKINLCTKKYRVFQSDGVYDGIAKIGKRLIVTSKVNVDVADCNLVVYDLCKGQSTLAKIGRTIKGAADIYADRRTKTIWVPAMNENKIIGVPFKSIKH